jgi:hypothetical protein
VTGLIYLAIATAIAIKVSIGWMQFYDVNISLKKLCKRKKELVEESTQEER